MKERSPLEALLALRLRAEEFPEWVEEYQFHPKRKWAMDFAWPQWKIAIETEGGVWIQGRHSRGKGFIEDCVKYAEAALDGWIVLRCTTEHIDSGEIVDWLRRAIAMREP